MGFNIIKIKIILTFCTVKGLYINKMDILTEEVFPIVM